MRGTISREHPWEVMPDLYFYRDPEEVKRVEFYGGYILKSYIATFFFFNRLKKKNRLQLRRQLERKNSRVNGAHLLLLQLLLLSSPSLR